MNRLARLQQVESAREIDYRYVKFNLRTAEGQAGYRDYILDEIKRGVIDPDFPDSPLNQQYRAQVYDAQHYYEAEAIMYAICKKVPSKGSSFVPVFASRPEKVDLFISFAPAKREKKQSPLVADLQEKFAGKKVCKMRGGKLIVK